MARGRLGRGAGFRRHPVAAARAGRTRRRCDRGHHRRAATNEETYLVQKLARAVFGNNNTDTCARVCHSPTGYGLKTAFGTSAGTQTSILGRRNRSGAGHRRQPDRRPPGLCQPVASAVAARAGLIVVDPRRDRPGRPRIWARAASALRPGTNVAVRDRDGHVIVTERLYDEAFIRARCDWDEFPDYAGSCRPAPQPRRVETSTGVPPAAIRRAAAAYATAARQHLLRAGRDRTFAGSTTVMAIANLAMMCGNIGVPGRREPLRGQNNVQGSCDMGSFPHEYPGYRHVKNRPAARARFTNGLGRALSEPGLRIPTCSTPRWPGISQPLLPGRGHRQSDPDTSHVTRLAAMDIVIVHDLFLNETANYAHVFPHLSFLEKDGTFYTNAERRINMVRRAVTPKERLWRLADHPDAGEPAGGMHLYHPSRDHGRNRADHAQLLGRQL